MASIARKNLFEDIPRFLVAQAGVMFAVSLVSIQTGILNGFTRSTALLIDQSRADCAGALGRRRGRRTEAQSRRWLSKKRWIRAHASSAEGWW